MKKIININLAGRVIPIEDAAYETLQRYIESLRRYFAAEEGRDEIINDIESRIAELMNDKVRKGATAVTEADIAEIMAAMGRVEDFEQADASENTNPTTGGQTFSKAHATGSTGRRKGRLYRDASDKILGGVCSGLAGYMNVDPAIVRLLFVIITFGGFGFGIFLYIIAWIFLPARDIEGFVGKRLFRNPDDRIIGGVAGGLAAYFRKEAWIFRAIFAAPLLFNILFSILHGLSDAFYGPMFSNFFVGSFTGTFFLIYVVLWIVLPEARSPFERMEMRGEKVDVARIRENVQQNMSDIGARAQAWGAEVTDAANRLGKQAGEFTSTRGKTFAAEVAQSGRTVGRGCGHAIGVLFKAFFLLIGGIIALSLFTVVVAFLTGGLAEPINDFLLNGFWQRAYLWGTLVFFLAVPLIAIITWIVRRLMKTRSQNRYLGWTFGGLWTLGWVSLMLFAASMTKDFRNYDESGQALAVAQPAMRKMTVRVDEPRIRYSGTFDWISDDDNDGGWDLTEDTLHLANVRMRFLKSPDSLYRVTLRKYSRGRNRADAAARAQKLSYTVSSLDSALLLGSSYGIGKEQKFRGQHVIVEIAIPAGRQIRFDESVADKLRPTFYNFRGRYRYNNYDWDRDWDHEFRGEDFAWQPNVDYTMTESGELLDLSKPAAVPEKPDEVYEYNNDSLNNQIDRLQREREERIERQRQKVEEENRRLKELQKDNTDATRTEDRNTGKATESGTGSAIEQSGLHTPIFSLLI